MLGPVILFLVVWLVWDNGIFHRLFGLREFAVPYPTSIVESFSEDQHVLLEAVAVTVPAALAGYSIGMVVGFIVASILVQYFPRIIGRLLPVLSSTNSLPIVALAPLIALFTGPGIVLKAVVVTIMTLPIMVAYAIRGLRNVDTTTLELMESLEATPRQIFRIVQLPTSLPFLFTALKSAIVLAIIGTIISETIRGLEGLGYLLADSLQSFETTTGWLALIAVALFGISWYVVLEVLERVVIPWERVDRST